MANANANAIHHTKHQKQTTEKKQENPNKFHHHFLYKAAVVAIFLVILPLFPSQAPEFINQSLLTRSWELLHLLLVGIAISYGLFSSRRNDETEKENVSKFDNAQTLVSRFLQVSSFFEDEGENSSSESDEITKVQTWNNQHHRNEPVVVVAPHEDQGGGGGSASSRISEKPLLLPVRSLKSRLSDHDDDVSTISSLSLNRSNSKTGSKRFSSNSSKARNDEQLEGPCDAKVENKMKGNVVLPSPIPWRSRSGRLEPKQEVDIPKPHASKPSMEDEDLPHLGVSYPVPSNTILPHQAEFNKMESRSVKSQTSHSPQSPLPSSPKFSSESLAKNAENLIRKKGFYNKPCPPPPPPPPPMFQKSISVKPRYGSFNEGASSFDKELKQSFSNETNGMNMNMKRIESGIEVKPKGYAENMSMGKSVRTMRAGQNKALFSSGREIGKEEIMEKEKLEDEEHNQHMSFRSDKFMGHASVPLVSRPASMEFAEELEKESFLDKVIDESDDEDTETDQDEDVGERIIEKDSGESPPENGESSKIDEASGSSNIGDEGPDVDKKADEFIAKFREQIREQIRRQRIESLKRSTKITGNSSR